MASNVDELTDPDQSQTDLRPPSPSQDAPASQDTIIIELTVFKAKALLISASVMALIISFGVGVYLQVNQPSHWNSDPAVFQEMGAEALSVFRQHDTNDDGVLDLREFEPLAHILVDVNVTLTYDLPVLPDDNVVTIGSHFQPLDMQTMQIIENNAYSSDGPELGPLSALKAWTSPAIEMQNFATRHFAVFMPEVTEELALGEAYRITPFGTPSAEDSDVVSRAMLSSNRFYPPRVTGDLITIHNLLAMLHPRPFINTRFPAQGSLACVRAYNDEYLDISFRVHAEFQLQETPKLPFWFTPAQFKGRLVISKDLSTMKYFRMHVPNNRRLNVDMEWLKNDMEHSMEVDIGYMAEMELRSTGPSRPATYQGYDLRTSIKPETSPPEEVLDGLTWTKEVQVDVCERAMEVVFYPFKTVPYYNYTRAYDVAREEDKLIHSIVLWGALDDQSC